MNAKSAIKNILLRNKDDISLEMIDDSMHAMLTSPGTNLSPVEQHILEVTDELVSNDIDIGSATNIVQALKEKTAIATQKAQLQKQWTQWKLRVELYDAMHISLAATDAEKQAVAAFNKNFRAVQQLHQSEQVKDILRKLQLSLLSFNELAPTSDFNDAKHVALLAMAKELNKLEIAQLELLDKARKLGRDTLQKQKKLVEEQKKELVKKIEKRSMRLSEKVGKERKHSYKFFRSRESMIHFNKHIDKTEKLSTVADAISSLATFGMNIVKFIPIIFHAITHAVMTFFSILPLVSAVMSILPMIMSKIIKPAFKRKDMQSLGGGVGIIAVIGALVAIVGAIPAILAFSGFISAALVIAGTISGQVLPLIKLQREIYQRNALIRECEQDLQRPELFPLSAIKKRLLFLKLEEFLLSSSDNLTKETVIQLQHARRAILAGDNKKNLLENPLIQRMISGNNEAALTTFMQAELPNYITTLQKDITAIKNERKIAAITLAGGTLAIAAAILCLIPTPVTWAVGGGLFALSAAIAVAVKFKWVDKWINKTPANDQEKELITPVVEAHDSTFTSALTLANGNVMRAEEELTHQVYPPVLDDDKTATNNNSSAGLAAPEPLHIPPYRLVEPRS